ncbi:MAG: DUF4158 domain-containing protein, partial [Chloroflexi bacterium]|nr:DUF4158 domain-containing protein [Chloroflexota bacterium]
MADKTPPLLTAEQRLFFTTIPEDLSAAELARYYTLLPEDLTFIHRQHGTANRLGMALQLCSLRFPGRPLTDLPAIPAQFIGYVAQQLEIDPGAFARYGERSNTLYEHLDRLRQHYGYRNYGWPVMLHLARHLLPTALESDDVLPLVEAALVYLRAHRIIVPGLTTLERLIGRVQRLARRRVYKRLTGKLTRRQTKALDDLLQVEPDLS